MTLDESGRKHVIVTQHGPPDGLDLSRADVALVAPPELADYLATQHTGMRLYIIGAETFLWDMHEIASQAGLGEGEIHLTHTGGTARRVYCAHCKAIAEAVTEDTLLCSGCGLQLAVHAQFSRRLKAHLGVLELKLESGLFKFQ
jgi:hypothetical protein